MKAENEETDCELAQSQTTQAVILETAQSVARIKLNEETGNNVRNFEQHQEVNSQEIDPLGIEILDNLLNIPLDDAMLYIVCHISQFHELVNQKLIQDRQLTVLIQVIGNFSSVGPHLELRMQIIRIATNQHFLGNILRYMNDSLAPLIHPRDEFSVHSVLNAGARKTNFTVGSALKHLLAYFTFVQENLKEFPSVEFTECSHLLRQLLDGKEHSKEKAQESSKANFGDEFELNLANTTATVLQGLLKTPFMSIVLSEDSSEVIKIVYSRRNELCELANSNFNFFLHILGTFICRPVGDPDVGNLQTDLLLLISTPNFVKQLSKYTTALIERLRNDSEYSENKNVRSTIEVFEEVLQYCNYLTTNEEIRDFIPADVYTELNKCVRAAEFFYFISTGGKVPQLSKEQHQSLDLLKNLHDETARELNDYMFYLQLTNKPRKTHTASSSSKPFRSQAQTAQEAFQQKIQNKLKSMNFPFQIPIIGSSSQLVKSTADVLPLENLTQICGMPVDQVFDLMCTERKNFVEFITQREISDNQLNMIAVIWSTLCNIPEFAHFQKSVFPALLNDAFLSRVFTYTRQRFRHFGEQTSQLYNSTTEFFGSLFAIYNLLWIHSESEPEEHLIMLKKNIRSVHDQLARLIVTYPQNKKIIFDGSTLAAIVRFNGRFKKLAETTKERTEGKKM